MFKYFKQLLAQLLIRVVRRLVSEPAPEPPPIAGNASLPPHGSLAQSPEPSPDDVFTGSPEEAAVHMHPKLSPVAKLVNTIFVKPHKDAPLPRSLEEIQLTKHGRAISQTTAVMLDGFNNVGKPEALAGLCETCDRFAFHGRNCAGCARFVCLACGRALDENPESPLYCPQCFPHALWDKDNWTTGIP